MRRREFVVLIAAATWPWPSAAQHARRTVAVLMPYPQNDAEVRGRVVAFRQELRRLGWADDTLQTEERWATDDMDRIRADAAELVKRNPDVIFFTGGRVTRILQEQTRSIPTVFVGVSDPLGQGLVPSLARPGGNLTGIALPPYWVTAKLLETLGSAVRRRGPLRHGRRCPRQRRALYTCIERTMRSLPGNDW